MLRVANLSLDGGSTNNVQTLHMEYPPLEKVIGAGKKEKNIVTSPGHRALTKQ